MATIAVIQIADNELDRVIVAEMGDYCPDGFYFVELPPEHTWHSGRIISLISLATGNKELVEF